MKKFIAVLMIVSLAAVGLWSILNWKAYHDA